MRAKPRLLLTSVFGPYGVDDGYGRKENIMELFHNQVTREQGLFSPRFHHQSFGLYMIAENLQADTTVLDFPSQSRFIKQITLHDYDYIGISFILPNFVKAQQMAVLIRRHAPQAKIILGGHGTSLPDVDKLIDCDYVCRGEGIRFMRKLLGEEVERPIVHPMMAIAYAKYLMGVHLPSDGVILMPGVGCPNACRFCCTSHFFDKKYTPYFHTGKEMFDFCVRAERERGTQDFWVMDENFLKYRERAEQLLAEMEKHDKHFNFHLFSSAETIREAGVDFMRRLGVIFVWLGLEGRKCEYEKNAGVDLIAMVRELREAGITVLGSVILFTDNHNKETINDDIDFAIESGADFIQFMQLAPWPDTAVFREYREAGRLREDIPYEEWHGQHLLWFDHPHFTPGEASVVLRNAFRRVWDEMGCSILRMMETQLNGYLAARDSDDPRMIGRRRYYRKTCWSYYAGLYAIRRFAHNRFERDYAQQVIDKYDRVFGRPGPIQRGRIALAYLLAGIETLRIKVWGNLRQPRTMVERFRPTPQSAPAAAETETTDEAVAQDAPSIA